MKRTTHYTQQWHSAAFTPDGPKMHGGLFGLMLIGIIMMLLRVDTGGAINSHQF